jgi:NitT/TauT family transport system substrate-binding protein
MKREAVDISLPNVTLNWQLSPDLIQRARIYADHMLEMKQIRNIPDFAALMVPRFSNELAKSAS